MGSFVDLMQPLSSLPCNSSGVSGYLIITITKLIYSAVHVLVHMYTMYIYCTYIVSIFGFEVEILHIFSVLGK